MIKTSSSVSHKELKTSHSALNHLSHFLTHLLIPMGYGAMQGVVNMDLGSVLECQSLYPAIRPFSFGIIKSIKDAVPPTTDALLPMLKSTTVTVPMNSSSICTWGSISPGIIDFPLASIKVLACTSYPSFKIYVILRSLIITSPLNLASALIISHSLSVMTKKHFKAIYLRFRY